MSSPILPDTGHTLVPAPPSRPRLPVAALAEPEPWPRQPPAVEPVYRPGCAEHAIALGLVVALLIAVAAVYLATVRLVEAL